MNNDQIAAGMSAAYTMGHQDTAYTTGHQDLVRNDGLEFRFLKAVNPYEAQQVESYVWHYTDAGTPKRVDTIYPEAILYSSPEDQKNTVGLYVPK